MAIKVVIVDVSKSLTSETCRVFSEVCLNEIAVLLDHGLTTVFMLACLGHHTEVLYPMQVVAERSLPGLKQSMEMLVQYHSDTLLTDSNCQDRIISQSLDHVVESYGRLRSNNYNQISGTLDILFVTCHPQIKNMVDDTLCQSYTTLLKKVTVLTLTTTNTLSQLPQCFTEIDDVTIPTSFSNLQRSVRSWIYNDEHKLLKLHLPNELEVSCDLIPIQINPNNMSSETQAMLKVSDITIPSQLQINKRNLELKAKHLIKLDQVCESVLFDSPALLLPTTHWNIDWDVLEKNQHTFTAFCKFLADKDTALLCQNVGEVSGLFLILGEPGGTGIVKPIICSELLLPKPTIPHIEVDEEAIQAVEYLGNSMSQIPAVSEQFSPLNYKCNLHEYLVSKMGPRKRKLMNQQGNVLVEHNY